MSHLKTTTVVFVSVVLGTITGLAYTVNEFIAATEPAYQLKVRQSTGTEPIAIQQSLPQVTVQGGTTHDFGAMEVNGRGSHTFVFQNTSEAPLMIKTKSTTCKCTVSQLDQDVVPAGGSRDVTLEWNPVGTSMDFNERAEIETNDPYHPIVELTIHGRVLRALAPVPRSISLQRHSASKTVTRRVVVFSYEEGGFELTGYELLNEELASHFDVQLDLAPTAEELAADQYAKSAIALEVTIRPGLPMGPIQQKLRLKTNVAEVSQLEIPIEGTIVSVISVVGYRFSTERNLLRLGAIDADRGARAELFVLVKGPHRDSLELRLGAVDPSDVLQVELGEPSEINNGLVRKYPLSVVIPPGTRAVNRLGTKTSAYAEVHIESDHPEAKDIPIYVEFTIQG